MPEYDPFALFPKRGSRASMNHQEIGGTKMATAGQVLENPVSGERITFHKTRADTDGESLVFELELSPDGHVPGAHVHSTQEERFEVLRGSMKFRKGIRTIVARAGEKVIVPPGVMHRFENAGDGYALARVEVRPALRMEDLLETAVAFAREGRTMSSGMPYPLELALFMREFEAEVKPPLLPRAFVRIVTAPLVWLARRRGIDRRYATLSPSLAMADARSGDFQARRPVLSTLQIVESDSPEVLLSTNPTAGSTSGSTSRSEQ
jgi:mannose-6-phosphate isomerase-like protein (cupin superfamily)